MIDGKYKLAVVDQRPAVMMGREEWLHSSYHKVKGNYESSCTISIHIFKRLQKFENAIIFERTLQII